MVLSLPDVTAPEPSTLIYAIIKTVSDIRHSILPPTFSSLLDRVQARWRYAASQEHH